MLLCFKYLFLLTLSILYRLINRKPGEELGISAMSLGEKLEKMGI